MITFILVSLAPNVVGYCVLKVREQENRYPSIMITFILVFLSLMSLADCVLKVREQENSYPIVS